MSWNNRWVGKPSGVVKAIDIFSDTLTSQSKTEFDAVKEGLKSLVRANSEEGVIDLDANGHAYTSTPSNERVSACHVTLRKLGRLIE